MIKFLLSKEIRMIKFKEIGEIILFYFKNNITINYQRILDNNIEVYDLKQLGLGSSIPSN